MSSLYFQAVGILEGIVRVENERLIIKINNKEYDLVRNSSYQKSFYSLKRQANLYPGVSIRVIVHPKVTHYPQREVVHTLKFALVGYSSIESEIQEDLSNLEFKANGIFQYIPVCKYPVISVFKNFSSDRLADIKVATPSERVLSMKPTHLPMYWQNSSVKPYKYIKNAEEPDKYFVSVICKLNTDRNTFNVTRLTNATTTDIPRHLKATKADKQTYLKENPPNTPVVTKSLRPKLKVK